MKASSGAWWCYDVHADPGEQNPRGMLPGCGPLIDLATRRFTFE